MVVVVFLGSGSRVLEEVRQANKPCQVPTSLVREQLRNAVLQVQVGKIGRSSVFSHVPTYIYAGQQTHNKTGFFLCVSWIN